MSEVTNSLVERIAAAASRSPADVEQTMNDFRLNLTTSSRRHRSVRIDRLRIRGEKAGEIEPGTFDETFNFEPGVTVIAADNLRGKTSILEVLTLVLRGEHRNLQADVLSWLQLISLDVRINGQPIGFRLSLRNGEITRGQILAGTTLALASSDDSVAVDAAELANADSDGEWAEQVGTFMMNQLGLDEIQVFNRARNDDEAGTIKSHGWPSYFSVLYPPYGADTVLLGSTASDFLPVRLMQVFLDMPEATRSMRVRALTQRLDSEYKAELRRGRGAHATLEKQLQDAKRRQVDAETRLEQVRDEEPAESLHELAAIATDAGARLSAARQRVDAAAGALAQAQLARVADEKALNGLRESKAASVLFHGLDPKSCPRCETPISSEKRSREHESHHCAICDTTLQVEAEDDYADRETQAIDSLAATRAAEKALFASSSKEQGELDAAHYELDAIDKRISQAKVAHQMTQRVEAEHELAAARAVVEALEAMTSQESDPPTALSVLTAADQVLREEISQASSSLYSELSNATRDLAVSFGIGELEGIKVKANGQMEVTKGGGSRSTFSSQSPGERLRLRYALVIALLRTARVRGIAGHPGLLLLDSLKAEEVQDDHAQTLLQGLVTAATEEAGLQIFVTTADQALAASVSGVAATITPKDNRTTLF